VLDETTQSAPHFTPDRGGAAVPQPDRGQRPVSDVKASREAAKAQRIVTRWPRRRDSTSRRRRPPRPLRASASLRENSRPTACGSPNRRGPPSRPTYPSRSFATFAFFA